MGRDGVKWGTMARLQPPIWTYLVIGTSEMGYCLDVDKNITEHLEPLGIFTFLYLPHMRPR
jgi:hypothetical protein